MTTLEEIITELETRWDKASEKYHSANTKTADYYLFLGKVSELGDVIDLIKAKMPD